MTKNKVYKISVILSILFLIIGMYLALSLGAKQVSFSSIIQAIVEFDGALDHQLIRDVRLPRLLCTMLAGGMLAICGALMQGVTRNPIAEPSVLGISQGATLAISVLYLNTAYLSTRNIVLASLLGALAGGLLIMFFASRNANRVSMGKLILAGTALSTFFLSLSTMLNLVSNNAHLISYLLGGGFRDATWQSVVLLFVGSIVGMLCSMLLAQKLNLIALGDEVCISLGEHPGRIRIFSLLLVILLSAISVAVAKNIAFVGLIIPQIVQRIVKKDYRYTLPLTFLFGSVLLVYSDILARCLLAPYEIPIGIFTSLIGVPFFLSIIRKERC